MSRIDRMQLKHAIGYLEQEAHRAAELAAATKRGQSQYWRGNYAAYQDAIEQLKNILAWTKEEVTTSV